MQAEEGRVPTVDVCREQAKGSVWQGAKGEEHRAMKARGTRDSVNSTRGAWGEDGEGDESLAVEARRGKTWQGPADGLKEGRQVGSSVPKG